MKLFIIKDGFENVFYISYKNLNKIPSNILNKILEILSLDYKYEISRKPKVINNYVEIGPKKLFKTSWNTNMLDIFRKSNIFCITNIEYSIKYPIDKVPKFDKMMYEIYMTGKTSDKKDDKNPYYVKDIELFNINNNLGFDNEDIEYYKKMFRDLNRNPTNV